MTKGITFNGRHSSEIAGISGVLEYGFPLIPPMRNKTVQISGRKGAIDGGRDSDPRPFNIVFLLDGNTIEDYFLKTFGVEQWLNTDEAKPFIYDVLPDRYLMARVTSEINPDRVGGYSRFEVQFTAFDPDFYAINETVKPITSGTTYAYEGSKPAKPILKITLSANAADLTITDKSGQFIKLARAFTAGDIVTIDNASRKILVNGQDARASMTISSRWLEITPPDYRYTISAAGTYEIRYRAKW
jgi:predicted phage tail component-like protein